MNNINMTRPYLSLLIFVVFFMCASMTHAKHYGEVLCQKDGFVCLKVKKGQNWEKLFPDEFERSLIMRINRMNAPLYPGLTIAIPNNLVVADIMDFSPFAKKMEVNGEKLVIVDPKERAWGAYDADGLLLKWGPLTAGGNFCKDIGRSCRTTEGSYRIYSLGSSGCISHKYPKPNGGAPMPYCMFFNNGQALHGSPGGVVGYNASHGCVRLYVNDAEWLRYDFVEGPNPNNNYRGTKVIVKSYE